MNETIIESSLSVQVIHFAMLPCFSSLRKYVKAYSSLDCDILRFSNFSPKSTDVIIKKNCATVCDLLFSN